MSCPGDVGIPRRISDRLHFRCGITMHPFPGSHLSPLHTTSSASTAFWPCRLSSYPIRNLHPSRTTRNSWVKRATSLLPFSHIAFLKDYGSCVGREKCLPGWLHVSTVQIPTYLHGQRDERKLPCIFLLRSPATRKSHRSGQLAVGFRGFSAMQQLPSPPFAPRDSYLSSDILTFPPTTSCQRVWVPKLS